MKFLKTIIVVLILVAIVGALVFDLPQLDLEPAAFPTDSSQAPSPTSLRIATFNIRSFSAKSRNQAEIALIAGRMEDFDLCAIQELRKIDALEILVNELNTRAKGSWSYLVSSPLGRASKELYAYVYKTERVQVLSPLSTFNDHDDRFIREPVWARFAAGDSDFVLGTIHVLFGDSIDERRQEAQSLLRVFDAMAAEFREVGESDFMLAGDFNLDPNDMVFQELKDAGYRSVNPGQGTTIHESPYDTIWYSKGLHEYQGLWGMEKFDETVFAGNDEAASLAVSDHRPLWLDLDLRDGDDD